MPADGTEAIDGHCRRLARGRLAVAAIRLEPTPAAVLRDQLEGLLVVERALLALSMREHLGQEEPGHLPRSEGDLQDEVLHFAHPCRCVRMGVGRAHCRMGCDAGCRLERDPAIEDRVVDDALDDDALHGGRSERDVEPQALRGVHGQACVGEGFGRVCLEEGCAGNCSNAGLGRNGYGQLLVVLLLLL
jgi:hypothetical protein